nr:hypothetical protein [Streptomyces sp. Ag82_O1-12]
MPELERLRRNTEAGFARIDGSVALPVQRVDLALSGRSRLWPESPTAVPMSLIQALAAALVLTCVATLAHSRLSTGKHT